MAHKYKVGDMVRVRKDLQNISYNGTVAAFDMLRFRGKEVTIRSIELHAGNPAYHMKGDKDNWFWTEDMLEPAEPRYRPTDMIIITTDGHETRSYHKHAGKLISEAKAVRSDADEHDFHFAAKLCIDRLFDESGKVESYYSGKLFIIVNEPRWIPIEIQDSSLIEVKDGRIAGFEKHDILKLKRFKTYEEICEFFDEAAAVFEVKCEVSA